MQKTPAWLLEKIIEKDRFGRKTIEIVVNQPCDECEKEICDANHENGYIFDEFFTNKDDHGDSIKPVSVVRRQAHKFADKKQILTEWRFKDW